MCRKNRNGEKINKTWRAWKYLFRTITLSVFGEGVHVESVYLQSKIQAAAGVPLCSPRMKYYNREISRSPWVRWAESLLERNVQLVGPGEEGIHLRRRLKYVP
jgi:hypothetical protein